MKQAKRGAEMSNWLYKLKVGDEVVLKTRSQPARRLHKTKVTRTTVKSFWIRPWGREIRVERSNGQVLGNWGCEILELTQEMADKVEKLDLIEALESELPGGPHAVSLEDLRKIKAILEPYRKVKA